MAFSGALTSGSSPLARGLLSRHTDAWRRPGSSPLARGLLTHPGVPGWGWRIIPARAGFTECSPLWACSRQDHPRSRGVYAVIHSHTAASQGSSPLARGLRHRQSDNGRMVRIIPARAGFTSCPSDSLESCGDHPRSRGVYGYSPTDEEWAYGSSPLARGLPQYFEHAPRAARIIPARAGFTDSAHDSSALLEDHPRSRGVYSSCDHSRSWNVGSSPLARGLQELVLQAVAEPGIIPARAGFTLAMQLDIPVVVGSSPLARGLHPGVLVATMQDRIIPARAGFTLVVSSRRGVVPDHPRSRGVYSPTVRLGVRPYGSSPLARGLRARGPEGERRRGIIPARAGFTRGSIWRRGSPGDHPRSRGVYSARVRSRTPRSGSSPLARGLHHHGGASPRSPGIIPARAGFTTSMSERLIDSMGSSPLARGLLRDAVLETT